MQNLFMKIVIRLVLLLTIVVLSNYIYTRTTYEKDLKAVTGSLFFKYKDAVSHANTLYFSASPNSTISKYDTDKRFISTIVNERLPYLNISAVDTGAIHAEVFKQLIASIPVENNIENIIVHVNYRSFGLGWIQSTLENAIQKQLVFYTNRPPIINRFLQGLNAYDAISAKERERIMLTGWKNTPLPFPYPKNSVTNWCAVEKWGDWKNKKRQLADNYIKNFAFVLDENNPRIKDFDAIVELCKHKQIALTFVILPENLEQAKALVDDDLVDLMKQNKDYLIKRYQDQVRIIDAFNSVSDTNFIERDFPSEHYNEIGRNQVAELIIQSFLQD